MRRKGGPDRLGGVAGRVDGLVSGSPRSSPPPVTFPRNRRRVAGEKGPSTETTHWTGDDRTPASAATRSGKDNEHGCPSFFQPSWDSQGLELFCRRKHSAFILAAIGACGRGSSWGSNGRWQGGKVGQKAALGP